MLYLLQGSDTCMLDVCTDGHRTLIYHHVLSRRIILYPTFACKQFCLLTPVFLKLSTVKVEKGGKLQMGCLAWVCKTTPPQLPAHISMGLTTSPPSLRDAHVNVGFCRFSVGLLKTGTQSIIHHQRLVGCRVND